MLGKNTEARLYSGMRQRAATIGISLVLLAGCAHKGQPQGKLVGHWDLFQPALTYPAEISFTKDTFTETFNNSGAIVALLGNYKLEGAILTLKVNSVAKGAYSPSTLSDPSSSPLVYEVRWVNGDLAYLSSRGTSTRTMAIARNGAKPDFKELGWKDPAPSSPTTTPPVPQPSAPQGGGLVPQPTHGMPATGDPGSSINMAPPPTATDPRKSGGQYTAGSP